MLDHTWMCTPSRPILPIPLWVRSFWNELQADRSDPSFASDTCNAFVFFWLISDDVPKFRASSGAAWPRFSSTRIECRVCFGVIELRTSDALGAVRQH